RDGETLEGYIFDRRSDDHVPHLRIMLKDGGRQCVNYASIAKLAFSGRDTAEGKAWETWVRKYVEQKRRGEKAGIASESLEE
ncbi:MAG: hypothetical protein MJA84_08640, partial [Firmicutes bacterium]|nr:hypothetical protein [Bacillota bacterium]